MKQLLIADSLISDGAPKDISNLEEGAIGFYHLDDDTAWLNSPTCVTKNFAIVLSRGSKATPIVIPEVDFSSLTVVRSNYAAATKFTAKVTISSVTVGKEYTVIVTKKGVGFHERNTWTATAYAKTTAVADVAANIVKQINASSETSGMTAANTGGVITFTASNFGEDYEIVCADELTGIKPTNVTNGIPAVNDKAYIKDLASRCAAGKGFNYTAEDAHEMYPGYPENIKSSSYTIFTLRFKVGRSGAKQRDEQVYQIVHIAFSNDKSSDVGNVADILGIGAIPTPSVSDGD